MFGFRFELASTRGPSDDHDRNTNHDHNGAIVHIDDQRSGGAGLVDVLRRRGAHGNVDRGPGFAAKRASAMVLSNPRR